uniref:hypothetical protein n=1 Tax=Cyanobium sp. TaxID=2164130 RepID=UPI004047B86D
MNYLEIGLLVGATLIYQDGTTTCTVVDGRHVNYNGEEGFLLPLKEEPLLQVG